MGKKTGSSMVVDNLAEWVIVIIFLIVIIAIIVGNKNFIQKLLP